MNIGFIREKIEASNISMEQIMQELGYKSEATFWGQIEEKTIRLSKIEGLFSLLQLTQEEARRACERVEVQA